jgi:hypothetical protein
MMIAVTQATFPWLVLFAVIIVGSGYGCGLLIRDMNVWAREFARQRRVDARLVQIQREAEQRRRDRQIRDRATSEDRS